MISPWDVFAEMELALRAPGDPTGARRGARWFAALSGQDHAELNVCGLAPDASVASAEELLDVVGSLPCVIFTSEHADPAARAVLVATGFDVATVREPLMWCAARPTVVDGPFTVAPAAPDQVVYAIALTAEAHHIDVGLLEASVGLAAGGRAEPWLAWDGDDPVSSVWLIPAAGVIGVDEMMTPPRHQRRGAGRQLLSTALAERWTPETSGALLLSTVAGRRLYESIGFAAVDEVITCFRGIDDDLLEAIGQTSAPAG
jgi:GNAT superfamily N-acetyltransferase